MNLLVTNDDGYEAEGINVLVKRLAKEHNVFVVAPSSNRSAVSHSITMFTPGKLKKVSDKIWACSGTPVDCVCIAIQSSLCNVKFDAVVAGINCGSNIGTDIIYSGTCGAARQGVLLGIPSIAVSLDIFGCDKKEGFKFSALADFTAKNLEKLVSLSQTDVKNRRTFVNINALSSDSYKGVKVSDEISLRTYKDSIEIVEEGDELKSIYHPGGSLSLVHFQNGDEAICRDGFISVSQVLVDPFCCSTVDCIDFSL